MMSKIAAAMKREIPFEKMQKGLFAVKVSILGSAVAIGIWMVLAGSGK